VPCPFNYGSTVVVQNNAVYINGESEDTSAARAPDSIRKDDAMSDNLNDDQVELPARTPSPEALGPQTGSARAQVDLAALSHPGHVRKNNEDHYLVGRFGRWLDALLTNLPAGAVPAWSEEVGYGLLVADGIGGAAGGEVASRMAISTLIGLALHTPDWIMSTEAEETEQRMRRMAERYRRVHAALKEQGRSDPALSGMGTTLTAASSFGARLVIGHIGDSRAYLFRGGALHQLTRDHTFVQALVDMGQLTAEQAARHPFRHVLTRSLGGRQAGLDGDFQQAWLADGDQLLLCTDGLTDMVDSAAIASVLGGAASATAACQALVEAALEKGGKDNVTVALARYRFPD
jgi:protein phosphatase